MNLLESMYIDIFMFLLKQDPPFLLLMFIDDGWPLEVAVGGLGEGLWAGLGAGLEAWLYKSLVVARFEDEIVLRTKLLFTKINL